MNLRIPARFPHPHAALMAPLLLVGAAMAGDAVVEKGDLVIRFERSARMEGIRRAPVRFESEAFAGRLLLAAPAHAPGAVKAGETLLTIDAKDLAEALDNARVAAKDSRTRLDLLKEERRVQAEQARTAVERAELGAMLADRALKLYAEYDKAKSLEMNQLRLTAQGDGLKDQKEELNQLEKMYGGTSLASETKDIVLDRARRGVQRGERYLHYATVDSEHFEKFFRPDEERRVTDSAKYAALDLDHARTAQKLAEIRAAMELVAAEKGAREAGERLGKLEADQAKLTVKAPYDGVWSPSVHEAGEVLNPWAPLGEVVDASSFRLRGTLNPEALKTIDVGSSVNVRFPSHPDADGHAKVTELNSVGTPEGESTAFGFLASLDNPPSWARVGMEAKVTGQTTRTGCLLVPVKAITTADGESTVKLLRDGVPIQMRVRIGQSDGKKTEILDGLKEGDRVVVPDA